MRVALAGNPNTGKTCLFNALTGSRAKVANYPGITVETREGQLQRAGGPAVTLIDVPGCYSLTARSLEEEVAHDILTGSIGGGGADVIVVVADASNLARNLYLVLQLAELGRPLVVALNMMDIAAEKGVTIDVAGLEAALGVPVAPVVAPQNEGLEALVARIEEAVEGPPPTASPAMCASDREAVDALRAALSEHGADGSEGQALWLLTSNASHVSRYPALHDQIMEARRALAAPVDPDRPLDFSRRLITARYTRIDALCAASIRIAEPAHPPITERIDRVLTHPVWGMGLFILAMIVLFQAVFTWAQPLIGGIEVGMTALAGLIGDALPDGVLREMLVDGVIAGVGNILVFLPQILLLFLLITIMEESGYMARVALLLDALM